MNASHLAQLMLEWEKKRRELDEIEGVIQETVLEFGKTQVVGNVRATYSAGRKQYDYETGAMDWFATHDSGGAINRHSKTVVDWKAVCEDAGIENIPFKQGEPIVKLKLEGKS